VTLRYNGLDAVDRFSWQVFTPSQLVDNLVDTGFTPMTSCAEFNEDTPPAADRPRMQITVERND
jgi:hypothetical protein